MLLRLPLLLLLVAPALAAAAADRPNILFVFTDDHAAHAIGAYGSRINATPHIDRLRAWAGQEGGGEPNHEFAMLYGIGIRQQRQLVAAGETMRVLISYGESWFPWYMRRLAERPANMWFVVKSALRR